MKQLLAFGLVVFALSGCGKKDEEQSTAAPPVDTYCMNYGQQDRARCPGFNYQQYGNYNNGYSGNGYNNGYGMNPQYAQWSNYNYTQGGCSPTYTPVYSQYGYACYATQANVNYYYYNNNLLACSPDYSGTCPSGYVCNNNYGAGVCAR